MRQHIDILSQKHTDILYFLRFTNRFWHYFRQNIDTKTYLVFRFGDSGAAQTYGKPTF